jgi:hypothetical protein
MLLDDEWRGVPLDRIAEWQAIFQPSREILDLSAPCPICGVGALHRWYQVIKPEERVIGGMRVVGRGGLWEWCSGCRCFEHYSCFVPEWWSCDLKVDEGSLTALPTAIEAAIRERERRLQVRPV